MDRQRFLEAVKNSTVLKMRWYRANPDTNPVHHPWVMHRPCIQTHNGEISLITPNIQWAEYSPKYDIAYFDGTTMIFLVEDYIMEIRLK